MILRAINSLIVVSWGLLINISQEQCYIGSFLSVLKDIIDPILEFSGAAIFEKFRLGVLDILSTWIKKSENISDDFTKYFNVLKQIKEGQGKTDDHFLTCFNSFVSTGILQLLNDSNSKNTLFEIIEKSLFSKDGNYYDEHENVRGAIMLQPLVQSPDFSKFDDELSQILNFLIARLKEKPISLALKHSLWGVIFYALVWNWSKTMDNLSEIGALGDIDEYIEKDLKKESSQQDKKLVMLGLWEVLYSDW